MFHFTFLTSQLRHFLSFSFKGCWFITIYFNHVVNDSISNIVLGFDIFVKITLPASGSSIATILKFNIYAKLWQSGIVVSATNLLPQDAEYLNQTATLLSHGSSHYVEAKDQKYPMSTKSNWLQNRSENSYISPAIFFLRRAHHGFRLVSFSPAFLAGIT